MAHLWSFKPSLISMLDFKKIYVYLDSNLNTRRPRLEHRLAMAGACGHFFGLGYGVFRRVLADGAGA